MKSTRCRQLTSQKNLSFHADKVDSTRSGSTLTNNTTRERRPQTHCCDSRQRPTVTEISWMTLTRKTHTPLRLRCHLVFDQCFWEIEYEILLEISLCCSTRNCWDSWQWDTEEIMSFFNGFWIFHQINASHDESSLISIMWNIIGMEWRGSWCWVLEHAFSLLMTHDWNAYVATEQLSLSYSCIVRYVNLIRQFYQ